MHAGGIPLDELPEEYKQYTEQIDSLRQHGLGLEEVPTYEEIIEWLKTHDGKMPRANISKNGVKLKRVDMTEDELEEVLLYQKWQKTPEKEALDACKRNFIRRFARGIYAI